MTQMTLPKIEIQIKSTPDEILIGATITMLTPVYENGKENQDSRRKWCTGSQSMLWRIMLGCSSVTILVPQQLSSTEPYSFLCGNYTSSDTTYGESHCIVITGAIPQSQPHPFLPIQPSSQPHPSLPIQPSQLHPSPHLGIINNKNRPQTRRTRNILENKVPNNVWVEIQTHPKFQLLNIQICEKNVQLCDVNLVIYDLNEICESELIGVKFPLKEREGTEKENEEESRWVGKRKERMGVEEESYRERDSVKTEEKMGRKKRLKERAKKKSKERSDNISIREEREKRVGKDDEEEDLKAFESTKISPTEIIPYLIHSVKNRSLSRFTLEHRNPSSLHLLLQLLLTLSTLPKYPLQILNKILENKLEYSSTSIKQILLRIEQIGRVLKGLGGGGRELGGWVLRELGGRGGEEGELEGKERRWDEKKGDGEKHITKKVGKRGERNDGVERKGEREMAANDRGESEEREKRAGKKKKRVLRNDGEILESKEREKRVNGGGERNSGTMERGENEEKEKRAKRRYFEKRGGGGLMSGRLILMILIDVILGLSIACLISSYASINDLYTYFRSSTKVVAEGVHMLLEWLRGAPAGLKLNQPLTQALASFFSYHVHLWHLYLDLAEPVLRCLAWVVVWVGAFGASAQVAVLADLLDMASLHLYCFYIYAARIHMLQISVLGSQWRAFRGRKWNPLKQRVDGQDSEGMSSVGTLGRVLTPVLFTLSLFLLPTTSVYYLVFVTLRIGLHIVRGILTFTIWLLNINPLYLCLLNIIGSSRIKGDIYFTTMGELAPSHGWKFGASSPLHLQLHTWTSPLSEVIANTYEENMFPVRPSPQWKYILTSIVFGQHLL